MKLIVGLGNPGKEYEKTRHNIGFMVLDVLAEKNKSVWKKEIARKSLCTKIDGMILAKPQTFMNESGQAVGALMSFYKILLENVLIVQDDLDLPVGTLAFKHGGSAAGHHGIESIEQHLGKAIFSRLRLGIGKPTSAGQGKDWVLSRPNKEERKLLLAVINDASLAIQDWVELGLDGARNKWNRHKKL